jgi:hypothetical protein
LFVKVANEDSFGVAAAWKEQNVWKTKTISLDRYLTEADATLFTKGIMMKDLPSILPRVDL